LNSLPIPQDARAPVAQPVRPYEYAAVLLIFCGALALRAWNAHVQALWNDEAFSWAITRGSLGEAMEQIRADFHPPGYYFLLCLWQKAVGDSVFALRLLSILAGSASVLISGYAAAILLGRRVGWLTGCLLAVQPTHILWSQIARGYAVGYLFASIALAGCAKLYFSRNAREQYLGLALLVVGATGACYIHNTGLLLLGTLDVALACCYWRLGKLSRLGPLLLANFLVALAYLPWLPSFLDQSARMAAQKTDHFEASPYATANWGTYLGGFTESLFAEHLWGLRPLMLVLAIGLMILGAWVGRRRVEWSILYVCLLLPPLCFAAGYLSGKPVFAYMFLISRWYHLPMVMACAYGLSVLMDMRPSAGKAAAGGLAILALWSAYNATHAPRIAWDQITRQAASQGYGVALYAANLQAYWAPLYYAGPGATVGLLAQTDAERLPRSLVAFANTGDDADLRAWETKGGREFSRVSTSCSRGACAIVFERR
jgi:uncharacterized membrane protein